MKKSTSLLSIAAAGTIAFASVTNWRAIEAVTLATAAFIGLSGAANAQVCFDPTGCTGPMITNPTSQVSASAIPVVAPYLRLPPQTSAPVACSAATKTSIAATNAGHLCVCDGNSWKDVSGGVNVLGVLTLSTSCNWPQTP